MAAAADGAGGQRTHMPAGEEVCVWGGGCCVSVCMIASAICVPGLLGGWLVGWCHALTFLSASHFPAFPLLSSTHKHHHAINRFSMPPVPLIKIKHTAELQQRGGGGGGAPVSVELSPEEVAAAWSSRGGGKVRWGVAPRSHTCCRGGGVVCVCRSVELSPEEVAAAWSSRGGNKVRWKVCL